MELVSTKKELVTDEINPIDYPMIRFFDEALAVARSTPSDASFAEVGTRSGNASILLLRAIKESGIVRWLFTIDPYGDKPYGVGETISTFFDYGEQHYRNALYSLSKYAWDNDLLHCHFRMRSQEFQFMTENIEFWWQGERLDHKFGFVYLDGEHTYSAISQELDFFFPRLVNGGVIVIDDISLIGEDVHKLPIKGEVFHNKLFYKKNTSNQQSDLPDKSHEGICER